MTSAPPPWLVTLLGAFVVALLGYLFGLRRTKQEKRWQATYEAYQRIFGAVHDIHFWANETYASNLMLPSVGRRKLAEASERFEDAKRALSSFVLVGGLVISTHAQDKLDDLVSAVAKEEFRFEDDFGEESDYSRRLAEHAEQIRDIVDSRMTELLREARADLWLLARFTHAGRRVFRAVLDRMRGPQAGTGAPAA